MNSKWMARFIFFATPLLWGERNGATWSTKSICVFVLIQNETRQLETKGLSIWLRSCGAHPDRAFVLKSHLKVFLPFLRLLSVLTACFLKGFEMKGLLFMGIYPTQESRAGFKMELSIFIFWANPNEVKRPINYCPEAEESYDQSDEPTKVKCP